jgi:hypothetical protein
VVESIADRAIRPIMATRTFGRVNSEPRRTAAKTIPRGSLSACDARGSLLLFGNQGSQLKLISIFAYICPDKRYKVESLSFF